MACRIIRDNDDNISKVLDSSGNPSSYYEYLKRTINIDEALNDPYIEAGLINGIIRDESIEEIAVALYSKYDIPNEAQYKDIDKFLVALDPTKLEQFKQDYKKVYGRDLNPYELADIVRDIENNTLSEGANRVMLNIQEDLPAFKRAAELIKEEGEYAVYKKEYAKKYDKELTDKELLNKAIQDGYHKKNSNRLTRAINQIINSFYNKDFSKMKEYAAYIRDTIKDKIEIDVDLPETDKIKYELSKFKKQLVDLLAKETKKLKIYEKRGKKQFTKKQEKYVKNLEQRILEKNYALGMVEAIDKIAKNANNIIKRFNELKQDKENRSVKEIARTLTALKDYLTTYKPIVLDIKAKMADTEELKEIRGKLVKIIDQVTDLETEYYNIAIPMLAEVLSPYVGNSQLTKEDIEAHLRETDDINTISRWWDSLANTNDNGLKLLDQYVKNAKTNARLTTQEQIVELFNLEKELKEAGIDNSFIQEQYNGKGTHNIVKEYNQTQFDEELNKFMTKLRNKYHIPLDFKERRKLFDYVDLNDAKEEFIENYKKELKKAPGKTRTEKVNFVINAVKKKYKKEQALWFADNTQPNSNASEEIRKKFDRIYDELMDDPQYKDEMFEKLKKGSEYVNKEASTEHQVQLIRIQELFLGWLHKNRGYSAYLHNQTGNGIYYRNELTVPNDRYANPQYDAIQNNPIKKKYYERFIELKEQIDSKLPEVYRQDNLLPQLRKDFLQRLQSSPLDTLQELKDSFQAVEDDTEFGMTLTDELDREVKFLPVFFTRPLQNVDDLSTDFTESLAAYLDMGNNYIEMNNIIDVLNVATDVINTRKVVKGNDLLGKVSELFSGKKAYDTKPGGQAANRWEDYMDMVVYGKLKEKEEWLSWLGLDTAKTVDFLNTYASIQGLALNVYSGFANVLQGNVMVQQERAAQQYASKESFNKADKTYWTNLRSVLQDIGKTHSESKLGALLDYLDVFENHVQRARYSNAGRTKTGRMFSLSSLYFINHAGEHQIQSRTALALVHETKLLLNGKEVDLWDAVYVKDGRIAIHRGTTKLNGDVFTLDDLGKLGRTINKINQDLFGIYNQIDRGAMQKYALGRTALLFRKFIRPGYLRRYKKQQYDFQIDTPTEGYYRTSGRFLSSIWREAKERQQGLLATTQEQWDQLEPYEQANIVRTQVEVGYMLAALTIGGVLTALADGGDDEVDDKLLAFTAYQANRLYTELSFYTNPSEALRILKSPAAAVNQIETILRFRKVIDPIGYAIEDDPFWRVYQSGKNKGDTYMWVNSKRLFPILNNIEKAMFPEEQLKMFSQ